MKKTVKIVAVMAIACVVALKAYDKRNVNVSDVVLANVEALADKSEIDNGGSGVVYGKWKRIVDSLGCYLQHKCATDGDGYICSPIGAITIIP